MLPDFNNGKDEPSTPADVNVPSDCFRDMLLDLLGRGPEIEVRLSSSHLKIRRRLMV